MTIHSKDGQSGLTKLDRISELSARDKFTVFNNLGHIINLDMLKELYRQLYPLHLKMRTWVNAESENYQ